MIDSQKNIALGSIEEVVVEEGLRVLTKYHDHHEPILVEHEINHSYIQFHFCLRGEVQFGFNNGTYRLPIQSETSLLLYNPQRELPIRATLQPYSWLVSVLISIKKFHGLFSREADQISFLNDDNKEKKYYKDLPISPMVAVVLSQISQKQVHSSVQPLYLKGKVFELMSLYFNRNEEANIEQCPFLTDESNVRKIRNAKEIIISRMAEPPSLQDLADEIGLSLKKLKEGFKQVYGNSVYGFLFDYKMEMARKMLSSGNLNVNEVGLRVGYSTASHFITAFKKKYNTTPKKYLMSLTL